MNTTTELFGSQARTGMHDDEVAALGLVVSYPPPPARTGSGVHPM